MVSMKNAEFNDYFSFEKITDFISILFVNKGAVYSSSGMARYEAVSWSMSLTWLCSCLVYPGGLRVGYLRLRYSPASAFPSMGYNTL